MTDARTRLSRFGSKLITFHPAPGANVNALIDVIPVIAALVLVSAIHGPRHGLIGMLGAMGGLFISRPVALLAKSPVLERDTQP